MKNLIIVFVMLFSASAMADDIFRIEVGKNYRSYDNQELRKRVWELERAVHQLQQRVFHLEDKQYNQAAAAQWVCRTSAFMDTYSAMGGSKAVAKKLVIDKCTKKHDIMHCDKVKCEK